MSSKVITKQIQKKVEPVKTISKVKINTNKMIARIGSQMNEQVKKEVEYFLKRNYDKMAYSLVEMNGIILEVIVYKLYIRKEAKLVK